VLVSTPVQTAPRAGVETDGFDLGSHLMRAMEGLDARSREAFLLKVGEDLEYPELASLTGASVPALKMRVKRARDHIRERWEKLDRA